MLKYVDSDIVFQEIPDEVTLAVNLSGCPCRCPGCHSKHLWGDIGCELTSASLDRLIDERGRGDITCVALMGGDAHPDEVNALMRHLRVSHPALRTAWYSGRTTLSAEVDVHNFDYIKIGPYLQHLGPLKSSRTNQRMYRITPKGRTDITHRYWRTTLK